MWICAGTFRLWRLFWRSSSCSCSGRDFWVAAFLFFGVIEIGGSVEGSGIPPFRKERERMGHLTTSQKFTGADFYEGVVASCSLRRVCRLRNTSNL
jgi:hypothetical protein